MKQPRSTSQNTSSARSKGSLSNERADELAQLFVGSLDRGVQKNQALLQELGVPVASEKSGAAATSAQLGRNASAQPNAHPIVTQPAAAQAAPKKLGQQS